MAVVERVIIKVDIDADINKDLAKVERRLKSLEKHSKGFGGSSKGAGRNTDKFDNSLQKLGKTLGKVEGMFMKFFKAVFKFSFVGMALEVGLLSAALVTARLAMASGRFVAKGYQFALRGVAAAAVAVTSAVAVAAAAVRQFSEAQLSPFVGGNVASARLLRGIDSNVGGLLGRKSTTLLTGQLGKLGLSASQSNSALTQLFNISGGDTKQLTSLVKGFGNGADGFAASLKGIGPQEKFITDQIKGMDKASLIEALTSGQLTPDAFKGVADNLSNTLLGSFKIQFAGMFSMFADMGASMIEPFRAAIGKMSVILRTFILNMSPLVKQFGIDSFAPSLVGAMQKTADFLERTMKRNLPKLEGFGRRLHDMWQSTRNFFRDMADSMRPLEAGANVIISMFGKIFGGFGGNGILAGFNQVLVDNADSFIAFGNSVGNLIRALVTAGNGDVLLKTVNSLTDVFNLVTDKLVPPLVDIAGSIRELVFTLLPPIINVLGVMLSALSPLVAATNGVSKLPGGKYAVAAGLAGLFGGTKLLKSKGAQKALFGSEFGIGAGTIGLGMMARNGLSVLGETAGYGGLSAAGTAAAGAGIITAIAGGGIATGITARRAFQGDTSKTNLGVSIAGGTATGAGVGALFGGPAGAAIGAIIGGTVAGVGTGITALLNKDKKENNAIEAAARAIDPLRNVHGTSVRDVSKETRELIANNDELKRVADAAGTSVKEMTKALTDQLPEIHSVQHELESNLNRNLAELSDLLGIASGDVKDLADNIGIDLLGATVSFQDKAKAVATSLSDFAGVTVGPDAIANSMFAKRENVAGANETVQAFALRALADGGFQNFTTADFQKFSGAHAIVSQDAQGGNLPIEEVFNNFLGFLEDELGGVGGNAIAADFKSAQDAILKDKFAPLAELFGQTLNGLYGQDLTRVLSLLEISLGSIIDFVPLTGANRAEVMRSRDPSGRSTDLGNPNYLAQYAQGVSGAISSFKADTTIRLMFNNVITPEAQQAIIDFMAAAGNEANQMTIDAATDTGVVARSIIPPPTHPSGSDRTAGQLFSDYGDNIKGAFSAVFGG